MSARLLISVLFCLGVSIISVVDIDAQNSIAVAAQSPDITQDSNLAVAEPVIIEEVDEIALKQQEMLDTIVLVQTRKSSGSGTIIDRLGTDVEQVFEYLVLTNAHVTCSRFIKYLRGVDSVTGKVKVGIVDTGCGIITFSYLNKDLDYHTAEVVSEDVLYDLSILSFLSKKEFAVVKMPDADMLGQIRVFDDVFAIGCQLGSAPSPTVGIISQILTLTYGDKELIIYGNTAQITPGSSGGGLFKKYDSHYYLIGIPYRIATVNNGQMIPHLSLAISMKTASEFIDLNEVTCP